MWERVTKHDASTSSIFNPILTHSSHRMRHDVCETLHRQDRIIRPLLVYPPPYLASASTPFGNPLITSLIRHVPVFQFWFPSIRSLKSSVCFIGRKVRSRRFPVLHRYIGYKKGLLKSFGNRRPRQARQPTLETSVSFPLPHSPF